MVKCLPEFEYFTVFLKNRNFISKIKRSKVTDYAALNIYEPQHEISNNVVVRPAKAQTSLRIHRVIRAIASRLNIL